MAGPGHRVGVRPLGDRTVYASLSFTTPHRLTVMDARTGVPLAPAILCAAQADAFTLAAGPDGLVAAGPTELLDPIARTRYGYPGDDTPSDARLITTVRSADALLLVTAHAFEGLRLWDLQREECALSLPLPDSRCATPCATLCAGMVEGRPYAVVTTGPDVSAHDLRAGTTAARWTPAEDRTILRTAWAPGLLGGRDALLTVDSQGELRTWEPHTGRPLTPPARLPATALHLSAAAVRLRDAVLPVVACTHGGGVSLIRLDTGTPLLDVTAPGTRIRTAEPTADGLLLLGTSAGPVGLDLSTAPFGERLELDLTGSPGVPHVDVEQPTPADLIELWGEDQVVTPAEQQVTRLGLPLAPLPGLILDGDIETDGLADLEDVGLGPADQDPRPVPEGMVGYRWLGTWHDDDLLLGPTGAVESIGPDTEYQQPLLVNTDLTAFVTFAYHFGLTALRQHPDWDPDEYEARATLLERRLRALDPAAFATDGSRHWPDALSDLASGF